MQQWQELLVGTNKGSVQRKRTLWAGAREGGGTNGAWGKDSFHFWSRERSLERFLPLLWLEGLAWPPESGLGTLVPEMRELDVQNVEGDVLFLVWHFE